MPPPPVPATPGAEVDAPPAGMTPFSMLANASTCKRQSSMFQDSTGVTWRRLSREQQPLHRSGVRCETSQSLRGGVNRTPARQRCDSSTAARNMTGTFCDGDWNTIILVFLLFSSVIYAFDSCRQPRTPPCQLHRSVSLKRYCS